MNEHEHHEGVIDDVAQELGELLGTSGQGIYLYLDDVHKLCNERFAAMLGYPSPEAWAAVRESFPVAFVAPDSQQALVAAYVDAIEAGIGSALTVTWVTASGRAGRLERDPRAVPVPRPPARTALRRRVVLRWNRSSSRRPTSPASWVSVARP